ncbi:unnamed protein product, partial [Polarella glacialis]
IRSVSRSQTDAGILAEELHRHEVEEVLAGEAWRGRNGFGSDGWDDLGNNSSLSGGDPGTYGEVTALGARQLARSMGIDSLGSESVVFMDLGSGVGRLVVQAFLEWPAVRHAVGVELCAARSAYALQAWCRLLDSGEAHALRLKVLALARSGPREEGHPTEQQEQEQEQEQQQQVMFIEGDLLAADVSQATHIYLSSLCFGDDLMASTVGKLASEARSLEKIASLRPLPKSREAGFRYTGSVMVEMTWTDAQGTRVLLYERS